MTNKTLFGLLMLNELKFFNSKRRGARDFLVLFFFFFIVSALTLLVISSKEGLLDNSVGAFLGKSADGSVPIYVGASTDNWHSISKERLEDFRDKTSLRADLFYRHEGLEFTKLYGFTSERDDAYADESYEQEASGYAKEKIKWTGKNVLGDSTIWQELTKGYDVKKDDYIILNKSSFHNDFDYAEYKRTILGHHLESHLPQNYEALQSIWLEISDNHRPRFFKFKVIWVDSIYDLTHVDYLMDIDFYVKSRLINQLLTFNDIKNNDKFKSLIAGLKDYLSLTKETRSVRKVMVTDKKLEKVLLEQFPKSKKRRHRITFDHPIEKNLLQAYINNNGFESSSFKFEDESSFYQVQIKDYKIIMTIPSYKMKNIDVDSINKHGTILVDYRPTARDSRIVIPLSNIISFYEFISYAKDQTSIDKSSELIESYYISEKQEDNTTRKYPAFMLDSLYKTSLKKLGFIMAILSELSLPYMVIFALIFIGLIWIQISMIITKRGMQYGILVAKGVSRKTIFFVLLTQMTLVLSLAIGAALSIVKGFSSYLDTNIAESMSQYRDIIDISHLHVLPIQIGIVGIIYTTTWLLAMFLILMGLYRSNILKKNGYIGELLD